MRSLVKLAFAALGLAIGVAWPHADAHAVEFSAAEIEIIRAYYRDAEPPRERQRPKRLPRGIAKNLARGKPLPPGIAKQTLPSALVVRLPPPPAGYERLVIAGKVLLIETATQVVHDVLTDVLFR